MFVRIKKAKDKSYLQIVENRREGKDVKQRVIATLGHAEEFISSGKLDNLTRSLLKYTQAVRVIDAHREGSICAHTTRSIGPALIFDRLWNELGLPQAIEKLLVGSRYRFSVERSIFLTVLHRLFTSGSDRAAERWKDEVAVDGGEELELHHLYRSMEWLGRRVIQLGSDPFTQRTTKDLLEEDLFLRTRDLFSALDVVFFDTTSIYFEGEGGQEIGRYGHSKDHRADRKQMVVGAVLDGNGRPICCELWPGNVTDVKTLLPVVERLKQRFAIQSICIVADRGMISNETIRKLEQGEVPVRYILGVRLRKEKKLRDAGIGDRVDIDEITDPQKNGKGPSALEVGERIIEGKRYVLCYNEEQARKDRREREMIVESLQEKLKSGAKELIGNSGYRRYLRTAGSGGFILDEEKIGSEARFDGLWVLTTNGELSAVEVARRYKELWRVEEVFRSMKSILETRPIYHRLDETIRGHVFCSFLALVLLKELESRLEARGKRYEWEVMKEDLSTLKEVEVEFDGQTWYLRTDLRGCCADVFQAVGVAVPPGIRH